jgi:hypothetical protein
MFVAPAQIDTDTYNHFLNRWNCEYIHVTLEKWHGNGLVPVLPKANYMFVHWTADDKTERFKDIYEVSVAIKKCPCCAHCWQTYGHWCTRHSPESHPSYFEYHPVKYVGYDFVTYMTVYGDFRISKEAADAYVDSAVAPVESAVAPVESAVAPVKRYNRIILEVDGEDLSFYDTASEASDSVPVEHMPRRSKRIRIARDFYYGY